MSVCMCSFHLRFGEWHSPVAMYGAKVRLMRSAETDTFSSCWKRIPKIGCGKLRRAGAPTELIDARTGQGVESERQVRGDLVPSPAYSPAFLSFHPHPRGDLEIVV